MFRLLYQSHHLANRLRWYTIEKHCILSFQFQYGRNISHPIIVYLHYYYNYYFPLRKKEILENER